MSSNVATSLGEPVARPLPDFCKWLAAKLGSSKWAIARRSRRLEGRYDVFLSAKRYQDLKNEWALSVDWSAVDEIALESYRHEVDGEAKMKIQRELARRWLS